MAATFPFDGQLRRQLRRSDRPRRRPRRRACPRAGPAGISFRSMQSTAPCWNAALFNFVDGQAAHFERAPHDAACFSQALCVPDHQRPALRVELGMSKALHDDFRTNAGGVSHGHRDNRSVRHCRPLFMSGFVASPRSSSCRNCRHRNRVSGPPKPPALVSTGISLLQPDVTENGNPASTSPISRNLFIPQASKTARAVSPPVTTSAPTLSAKGRTIAAKRGGQQRSLCEESSRARLIQNDRHIPPGIDARSNSNPYVTPLRRLLSSQQNLRRNPHHNRIGLDASTSTCSRETARTAANNKERRP